MVAESLEQIIRREGFFLISQVRQARHAARTHTSTEEAFKARLRRLWYADRWMGIEFHYPRLLDEKCHPHENIQAMKTLMYKSARKSLALPVLISEYRKSNLKAERTALRQLSVQSWKDTGFSKQTHHMSRYWFRQETLNMKLAMASSSAAKRCYSVLERAVRRLL